MTWEQLLPAGRVPEWRKWLTIKLENEEVTIGQLRFDFCTPLAENYEAHNQDYQGWYTSQR